MYFYFVVPASGRREPIRDLLQKEQQDRFPITDVGNDNSLLSSPPVVNGDLSPAFFLRYSNVGWAKHRVPNT